MLTNSILQVSFENIIFVENIQGKLEAQMGKDRKTAKT